jgi:hypothetical protein
MNGRGFHRICLIIWRINSMRKIRVIITLVQTHLVCQSRTFRPTVGEFPMKTMVLAAFGVLALGMGAASAQGVGATATAPMYGQKWAELQRADRLNAIARASGPSTTTGAGTQSKDAREQPIRPNRGG